MDIILVKQYRNKKNPSDIFMISLQFKEDFDATKSDFEEEFDKQIKELITEFADVTEEHERLPPHRGMLDHKVKLIGYPHRQRRNILTMHEYDDPKRQCMELFQQGKIRVSNSPYVVPIVMVRKPDGSVCVYLYRLSSD
jgi:hypothetical protein